MGPQPLVGATVCVSAAPWKASGTGLPKSCVKRLSAEQSRGWCPCLGGVGGAGVICRAVSFVPWAFGGGPRPEEQRAAGQAFPGAIGTSRPGKAVSKRQPLDFIKGASGPPSGGLDRGSPACLLRPRTAERKQFGRTNDMVRNESFWNVAIRDTGRGRTSASVRRSSCSAAMKICAKASF